jgi:adenine-specific DNA methylase
LYHQILENNIFGVDINLESTSITKLSLWLRIAQGKRKLNDLNQNIKVGNSLISDKKIDEKAFNWTKEFPKVQNGFDLIVGNPPYVSIKIIKEKQKKYFLDTYKTAKGQFDLYGLFIEKSQNLLKKEGILGFITSSTFLSNKDFSELRKFIFNENKILQITYLGETVFKTANVDVSILILKKENNLENHQIKVIKNREDFNEKKYHLISQNRFDTEKNNYEIKLNSNEQDFDLIDKIYYQKELLGEILHLPRGIEIGGNSEKIINKPKKDYEKIIVGKNVGRYKIDFTEMYISFENDKSTFKDHNIYKQPKILIQRIRNLTLKNRIVATLDKENYLCTNTLRIGILKKDNYEEQN